MKAKTSVAILIALIALFGTVFFVIVKSSTDETTTTPSVAGSGRPTDIVATKTASPATSSGSAEAAPIVDPLPGQGRARLVRRAAPAGRSKRASRRSTARRSGR